MIIKVPIIITNQRGIQLASSQWTLFRDHFLYLNGVSMDLSMVFRDHFLCTAVAVSLCQRGGHHAHDNKFSCKCYQFLSNSHKIIILKIWCTHCDPRPGITRFVYQPHFRSGPKSLSRLSFPSAFQFPWQNQGPLRDVMRSAKGSNNQFRCNCQSQRLPTEIHMVIHLYSSMCLG